MAVPIFTPNLKVLPQDAYCLCLLSFAYLSFVLLGGLWFLVCSFLDFFTIHPYFASPSDKDSPKKYCPAIQCSQTSFSVCVGKRCDILKAAFQAKSESSGYWSRIQFLCISFLSFARKLGLFNSNPLKWWRAPSNGALLIQKRKSYDQSKISNKFEDLIHAGCSITMNFFPCVAFVCILM